MKTSFPVFQTFTRMMLFLAFIPSTSSAPLPAAVFNTNRVASIDLKISEADWNILRYQHREAEFFPEEGKAPLEDPYTWFPAEVTIDGAQFTHAEIRKKGYIGSNDIRRPALKVRIFPEAGADSTPKTKSGNAILELTLNNNRQDPSLIRQYLAYEVFRRANVPAPRCSFGSIRINGKDLGIYTCLEPINATFLKQHFARSDGNLYEGGRSDFRSNWVQNFSIKNKRAGDKTPAQPPRADLETATAALENSKASILPALDTHFDADEFFRFWAIESLINETDGYAANMNNFYLYNNPATGKFVFIPWGADSTFASRRSLNSAPGDPRSVIGVGILANRLYNSDEGAAKYRATLHSLLDTAWDEPALVRETERLEKLLTPFLKTSDQVANFVSVRQFIKSRRAELAPELKGPPPQLKSKPLELAKRRNVGQFTGAISTRAGRSSSAELSGTLWGEKLNFKDVSGEVQFAAPEADAPEALFINIVANSGTNQSVIYLGVDSDSITLGKPIPIDNTHIEGMFAADGRYVGMLRGSLLLTKADKATGEISGQFTVDLFSKHPKQ